MVAAPARPTVLAAVTDYAERVVSGEIVAGKPVRLACERHLRDLENAHERGLFFDEDAAQRAVDFIQHCKHSKGEWAGKNLELADWQLFIVGSVFGWKRTDGTRRFREVYNEVARKNGKSTFVASVGLYLTCADEEPGAEVYSFATKEDQARIVWSEASRMAKQTPALMRRLVILDSQNNASIAWSARNSFFKPLARSSDTESGLNPHGAIGDELHEFKTRNMVDIIETAVGARRQPLIWYITTAGWDQSSIWWEKRSYALMVVEGAVEDDSVFVYIATLDMDEQKRQYSNGSAVRCMAQLCTCEHARTTPTEKPTHGDSVRVATTGISGNQIPNTRHGNTPQQPNGKPRTGTAHGLTNGAGLDKIKTDDEISGGAIDTEFTDSPKKNTQSDTSHRTANAPSAEHGRIISTSTTATMGAAYGDSSANHVTPDSVSSETLRKLYNEHSTTCEVRQKAELSGDTLTVTYPPDDWRDEAVWPKANPNLGISKKVDKLREDAAKADAQPSRLNSFLRYEMNVPTEQAERWIDMTQWDNCGDEPQVLPGARGFAGLDLASTIDLSAAAAVFPRSEGWYDVLCRFWRPQDTVIEAEKRDKVPYRLWAEQGYLQLVEGSMMDPNDIADDFLDWLSPYNIVDYAFDSWNARGAGARMLNAGANAMAVTQGFQTYAEPCNVLDGVLLSGKLRHGNNPILRWMAGQVMVMAGPNDARRPFKPKGSSIRDDGIAAMLMAISRALVHQQVDVSEPRSWSWNELPA